MLWRAVFLMWALMAAVPLAAQEAPATSAVPVLIIDSERVFAQSRYAETLRVAVETEAETLSLENERIVADLTAEEQSLTERRPSMEPDAFRAEAEAFDQKVQDIRRARDAKEAEINQARIDLRARFFDEVRPLIGQVMVERGAVVVMDSRSIVVAVRRVDITDALIARIDAELAPEQ